MDVGAETGKPSTDAQTQTTPYDGQTPQTRMEEKKVPAQDSLEKDEVQPEGFVVVSLSNEKQGTEEPMDTTSEDYVHLEDNDALSKP